MNEMERHVLEVLTRWEEKAALDQANHERALEELSNRVLELEQHLVRLSAVYAEFEPLLKRLEEAAKLN